MSLQQSAPEIQQKYKADVKVLINTMHHKSHGQDPGNNYMRGGLYTAETLTQQAAVSQQSWLGKLAQNIKTAQ